MIAVCNVLPGSSMCSRIQFIAGSTPSNNSSTTLNNAFQSYALNRVSAALSVPFLKITAITSGPKIILCAEYSSGAVQVLLILKGEY